MKFYITSYHIIMVALCVTENDRYILRRVFFLNILSPLSLETLPHNV